MKKKIRINLNIQNCPDRNIKIPPKKPTKIRQNKWQAISYNIGSKLKV